MQLIASTEIFELREVDCDCTCFEQCKAGIKGAIAVTYMEF